MEGQSRRFFMYDLLRQSLALMAGFMFIPSVLFPEILRAAEIVLPQSRCTPESNSTRRILVTYASSYGSTGGVAKFVADYLCDRGYGVDLLPLEQVTDLQPYDALVLGSPIQYDKWRPEACEFLARYKSQLATLPLAYFFTCLTLSYKSQKNVLNAENYALKIRNLQPNLHPLSVGQFAGTLDYSKMPFFARILARPLFAVMRVREGDYRNWNAIKAWTIHFEAMLRLRNHSG